MAESLKLVGLTQVSKTYNKYKQWSREFNNSSCSLLVTMSSKVKSEIKTANRFVSEHEGARRFKGMDPEDILTAWCGILGWRCTLMVRRVWRTTCQEEANTTEKYERMPLLVDRQSYEFANK